MIRWGAMLAGVFAVGLAAGWFLSGAQASVAPGNSSAAPPLDAAESARLRSELMGLEDDLAMLDARNDALESNAAAMRNDQLLMDEVLQEAALPDDAPDPADAAPLAPPDTDPWRGGPRPSPEQMAEFRKNFEAQQTHMEERLAERLTAMNDPNAVDSFNALMELQQQQQELRDRMRDATTDQARAKIQEQLRETRQAARQTLSAQQDALLRSLAASSGIKDTQAQQEFVGELRATLENPFFSMESTLLGGRGGPRGMGFGGPRDPLN